jgi:antitoxin (DNA-binding transcriptional repressor) of toxin-antitoxin stability system
MQITISAEELESRCLELIDQIEAEGLTVVVTKLGLPFVMLFPVPAEVKPLDNLQAVPIDATD